jgi:hypothetical protein
MPSDERVRLDDGQQVTPTEPIWNRERVRKLIAAITRSHRFENRDWRGHFFVASSSNDARRFA